MPLNQSEQFGGLPTFVQAAFQTKLSTPTKELLPVGMRLYKFNNFPSLHPPGDKNLSPWWSPYDAFKHDAGWQQKVSMAKANGISVREWGRLTSAVKENWNSLAFLLEITLGEPAYGFFGGFAQMVRIDSGEASKMKGGEGKGASKNLPGGATQIYIPNLTADHVTSWKVTSLENM